MNKEILSLFEILKNDTSNIYKARAFETAIRVIESLKYELNNKTYKKFASEKIEGISTGILSRIEEYCKTGTIKEISKIIENANAIAIFTKIKGVGDTLARTWIDKNILTIPDLKKAIAKREITLTTAQKYGLLYYNDLNERIPRDEINDYTCDLWRDFVVGCGKICHNYNIVGSYRRGLQSSGDVDILLLCSDKNAIIRVKSVIENRKDTIVIISSGEHGITYLYTFAGKVRQCDILLTTKDNYIPALVYFTGSKNHCIYLRKIAKQQGYILNQYHLKNIKTNKVVSLKTEEELYSVLGLKYIKPENRH